MTGSHAGDSARAEHHGDDGSIGRIVSVTGSKAIVLLDNGQRTRACDATQRPEMGTLLAIDTAETVVLAIVSALSVPVPAQREGESEIWIAELGLVGELWRGKDGRPAAFNRGVTIYPSLGDRVRVASECRAGARLLRRHASSRCASAASARTTRSPPWSGSTSCSASTSPILGTTGTGKSCTTALILRAILEKNPAAHIVLLDPAQRVRDGLHRVGRGDLAAQHAAAVLAADVRGAGRGRDRRSGRAQARDRDPAGADPDRQEPLQRRPRQGSPGARARACSTPAASRSTRRFPTASRI